MHNAELGERQAEHLTILPSMEHGITRSDEGGLARVRGRIQEDNIGCGWNALMVAGWHSDGMARIGVNEQEVNPWILSRRGNEALASEQSTEGVAAAVSAEDGRL